ncbi:MAG: hypothetical protein WCG25_01925 [bacterium]
MVIEIHAFIRASSNASKGLFHILHHHVPTNLTFPYLCNHNGIKSIDALNFVANSDVRSKKSCDFSNASSANLSIFAISLIQGLFNNFILFQIR